MSSPFPNPNSQDIFKEIEGKLKFLETNECKELLAQNHMYYKRFDRKLPTLYKENEGNAGFDLFARLDDPIFIAPGEVVVIPLNLATDIPAGYVGLLFQRSSTYRKWKLKLTNSVGIVDSLFCGDGDEWAAEVKNESDDVVYLHPGDKICQALFFKTATLVPYEVMSLGNEDRGGFGTSFDNAAEVE